MKDNGFDWTYSLFLPETNFPMRNNDSEKIPEILKKWDNIKLNKKLDEKNKNNTQYILHDGPPYANGNIHMGHALNKVLKDTIVRFKRMQGFYSPYVPGWDCHGLPIEWKVENNYINEGKEKKDISVLEFRKACRQYAEHWVEVQKNDFKNFGIIGDFENPYLTMDNQSEAMIAKEFMKLVAEGKVKQGSKPVFWSPTEETALAEAEIIYKELKSETCFVLFPIQNTNNYLLKDAHVVIWTTTPWTLPANRAICYSKNGNYALYKVNDKKIILSVNLAENILNSVENISWEKLSEVNTADFEHMTCTHPFKEIGYNFSIPLLDGEHVSTDDGTGFVHTAPAHGKDDFIVWLKHQEKIKSLGISTDIIDITTTDGKLNNFAYGFENLYIYTRDGRVGEATKKILLKLEELGFLLKKSSIKHNFPCSWRSGKPLITKTTPQWFISMDAEIKGQKTIRQTALEEIENINFIPETGKNRLKSMIENRPDWLVSRQRVWGVPLCIFRNKNTNETIPGINFDKNEEYIETIYNYFFVHSSDIWFSKDFKESILKPLVENIEDWIQELDVLDVWFDSGCTHSFVLRNRYNIEQADLYLEGSDQHRGWFQSSLLESCANYGKSPFKNILTHGFITDEKGEKLSKSSGMNVPPEELAKKFNMEAIRAWILSSDVTTDIQLSEKTIKTSVDSVRKIRNTFRWILGVLAHYNNEKIKYENLENIDKALLHELYILNNKVYENYEKLDIKNVWNALFSFINHFSSLHADSRKDRLYCESIESEKRISSLFAINEVFNALLTWYAPLLPFLTEEIFENKYSQSSNDTSVHLLNMYRTPEEYNNIELHDLWKNLLLIKNEIDLKKEYTKNNTILKNPLDYNLIIKTSDEYTFKALNLFDSNDIFGVSQVTIIFNSLFNNSSKEKNIIEIEECKWNKCERSWKRWPDVGINHFYPTLSSRDAKAIIDGLRKNMEMK